MLLQIQDGSLSIGGQTILSHFHFEIKGTEKIALVGRNGSGKTTLLKLLAGELHLDRDDSSQGGLCTSRRITTGLLHQQAFSDPSVTLEQELLKACPCPDQWDRDRFAWEQEYDRVLTGFGLSKEDKKKTISQFSGGEQTKLALIRLLLQKPDLLLLDEPTNHLDADTTEWLEAYLWDYEKAVVIVSHDRYFLDQTADVVWELQDGRLTRYAGNYTSYREQKLKNIRLQEKAYQNQQEEIQRLENLIERFKHKPKKAAFARSRKKILERMPRVEKPCRDDAHIFTGEIAPETLSSKWVLEAEHLQIGYDRALLEFSLRVRRGQKIGIIGPNGAGKTTFLKTAAGLIPPFKGKCTLGLRVQAGYFDQHTASLSSDQSVAEHFHSLFPAMTEKEVRDALGSFLFSGRDAQKKVSSLSGGEKSRLVLAELFQSRPNFFILDEPTNHMDIPARETLESAFRAYTGTMLFVSHDRYFIRQVADALLVFGEDSVLYYPFGYAHYMEYCGKNASRTPAGVQAEEQALISGLLNVPKAERRPRELSTEQMYEDWRLSLAAEPLEQCRCRLEDFYAGCDWERLWRDPSYPNARQEEEEALLQEYTARCLEWYDVWAEFHPGGRG